MLVAEDDPGVAMTLVFVLQDEGFEVVVARDGVEALTLARSRCPDAILLDQMMPKMSGKQVLSELRAQSSTEAIPVFVLSGMPDEPGEWPGAVFVGKPFDPDDLVALIRERLPKPV